MTGRVGIRCTSLVGGVELNYRVGAPSFLVSDSLILQPTPPPSYFNALSVLETYLSYYYHYYYYEQILKSAVFVGQRSGI